MKYTEKYYKTLNYADYLNRQDRYDKLAVEICNLLEMLSLINKNSILLDYGCATGMLMKGIIKKGYQIVGYDVSNWATQKAKEQNLKILTKPNGKFNAVFALDVLEHMTDSEILATFSQIISDALIIRVPVSEDKKRYVLDISNKDNTHVNYKNKKEWKNMFKDLGFFTIPINLFTIYDSKGVFSALCLNSSHST